MKSQPRSNADPGGMPDNSPAFQRRDTRAKTAGPGGTTGVTCLPIPSGIRRARPLNPAFKRRAIIVLPRVAETSPLNNS
jgi:hypothetical protein